ncbi:hypothetical protein [Paludibacterium yongneupense]|uniref:COG4648 family protein n=1 Tax=Paludibacterium yongneupense TaxID=400061 RepID=UPI0003F64CDA|nr:hypothetical protein [Paludibacterium yongneupense]
MSEPKPASSRLAHAWRPALAALSFAAYPVFSHFTTVALANSAMGAVFAIAPMLAVGLLAGWRTRWRGAALLGTVLAIAGMWRVFPLVERHFNWVYFIQNAGTNGALGMVFGLTLLPGALPICTRFSRMLGEAQSPRMDRYTRGVTLAWTLFFATITALSTLLFFAAPVWVWSTFANLLYFPLLAAMFACEYALRRRRFPHVAQQTLAQAMRSARALFDRRA